jgi:hypothetical protein
VRDPFEGYTFPFQVAYQFPQAQVNQPATQWYPYPFPGINQFPNGTVNQPGPEVPYLYSNPTHGMLGGQPYLYHR